MCFQIVPHTGERADYFAACFEEVRNLCQFQIEGGQIERGMYVEDVPAPVQIIQQAMFLVFGQRAQNPFGKTKTPVDAYCACLIDRIEVE